MGKWITAGICVALLASCGGDEETTTGGTDDAKVVYLMLLAGPYSIAIPGVVVAGVIVNLASGGMPGPASATVKTTWAPERRALMVTTASCGEKPTAFASRL